MATQYHYSSIALSHALTDHPLKILFKDMMAFTENRKCRAF